MLVLALLLAWPIGLALWANGRIEHVEALSGAANTPGTTYLLAGSDSRADGVIIDDETTGSRTDTIMLLEVPTSGPAALISLPRDTYVDIPGHGPAKLNASFSIGGAPLLVATVEQITGLTVDHYVEIGFAGVEGVVDAVGGVELCLDYDVNEPLSGLVWTAGCHVSDGVTALAFARMRYADPEGDIGRAHRQQQLIAAITHEVAQPSLVLHPGRQVSLIRAGTDALTVSSGTDALDLAQLALAFRKASGPGGITGTPPIANPDYRPGDVGSTVLLDPDLSPAFWAGIRDGSLPVGTVGGLQ
ncbi:MAG: LCP family protein [Cellulomonadaceae bacterium]|nr:LCP family protein [Cellulomonadaceae bacterium]